MKTECDTGRRGGFTLVELLVVSMLGSLLLLITYQVLITNQRTYSVQAAHVSSLQTTRAGLDLLSSELREISTSGGDLIEMDTSSLTIRTMRRFGLVCDVTSGGTPTLRVRKFEAFFEDGDSVFVFAENDEDQTTDDVWFGAEVTAIDTTTACDGRAAQTMSFGSQQQLFTDNDVQDGAIVRSYDQWSYGLYELGGQTYVGRRGASGTVPLVGPIDASGGLDFAYLDQFGNTTTTATDVAQIVITIKTTSDVRTQQGTAVMDSVQASVYPRN